MTFLPINVTARGAVRLGDDVTCDGFTDGPRYRVQTHVHTDHMRDFNTSKGRQDILMSPATRELLIAEYGADLPYRENVIAIERYYSAGDVGIELLPSRHMLGSVQAAVTLPNGMRLGYSGDFQWPLNHVIHVDGLVVDSTYGSPNCKPHFPHDELRTALRDVVSDRLRMGPVIIKAFQGKMERAMEILSDIVQYPSLASPKLCHQVKVYRNHGYNIGRLIATSSVEGRDAMGSRRYLHYISTGDAEPDDMASGTVIKLTAFMRESNEPMHWDSERSCTIALSDHADFDGTIEYVRATGAHYVVTDSTRSPHAADLAIALQSRLGVQAYPSSQAVSLAWGA